MSEQTFHTTKEDVRRLEQHESANSRGGQISAGSKASTLQSIVDKNDKGKADLIDERKANLPLPDAPPGPGDFNSADHRTVNVGSGGLSDSFSAGSGALREPATGVSSVRAVPDTNETVGRAEGVGREGIDGIPNDAVARGSKHKAGLADTTGKDYGYPHKSDPSSGIN